MPYYLIAAFVLMVASYLITSLATPRQAGPKAATLDEFQFPQAEEGTPQAVVFGDTWLPDWTVLYYGDLEVTKIMASGGKK